MKQHHCKAIAAMMVLGLWLIAGQARASRPFTNLVTGTVTSISANQIVIDGKSYSVSVNGPALGQLEQLHDGQQVQLVLDGPPDSAATQVVGIYVQNSH